MNAAKGAFALISITLIGAAMYAYFRPDDAETVSEPASPEDRAARQAYFQYLVRLGAIGPCSAVFPERASSFDQSHRAWLRENSQLIALGKESIRAVAGPDFDKKPYDVGAAERQITALLAGFPAEKRLPWCKEYF
jgi:hypothetical protein